MLSISSDIPAARGGGKVALQQGYSAKKKVVAASTGGAEKGKEADQHKSLTKRRAHEPMGAKRKAKKRLTKMRV